MADAEAVDVNVLIDQINTKLQMRKTRKAKDVKTQKVEKLKAEIKEEILVELEEYKKKIKEDILNNVKDLIKTKEDLQQNPQKVLPPNEDVLNEIKEDLNTHEENFEKVQENFIKMNNAITEIENNQKIFNEMIITMKDTTDNLKKKMEEKLREINSKMLFVPKEKSERGGIMSTNENLSAVPEQGPMSQNGYVNNYHIEFCLEDELNLKEKMTQNNKKFEVKSKQNNIVKGNKQKQKGEKVEKNTVYNIHSPLELNEVDKKIFNNYLKKYVIPMKNFENVFEIEMDFDNEGEENNEEIQDDDAYIFENRNEDDFDIESL